MCSSLTRTARSARTSKAYLKESGLSGAEFNLAEEKEGRMRIREFLPHVKRDDKGAIILPTLVLREGGRGRAAVSTPGRSSRRG